MESTRRSLCGRLEVTGQNKPSPLETSTQVLLLKQANHSPCLLPPIVFCITFLFVISPEY